MEIFKKQGKSTPAIRTGKRIVSAARNLNYAISFSTYPNSHFEGFEHHVMEKNIITESKLVYCQP